MNGRLGRAAVAIAVIVGSATLLLLPRTPSPKPDLPAPSATASLSGVAPEPSAREPTFVDPGAPAFELNRLTAQFGWALLHGPTAGVGDGSWTLAISDDAGASWRDGTPPEMADAVPSIQFLDPQHGWVLQALSLDPDHPHAPIRSALWRTSDGGRHWQKGSLPTQAIFEAAISFFGPKSGYLVLAPDAEVSHRRTLAYSTTDAGSTWKQVGRIAGDLPFDWPYGRSLVALSADDALLVRGGGVVTHDTGRTWSPVDLPRPEGIPSDSMADVFAFVRAGGDVFASVQFTWKSGASYTYVPGYVFVSHDAGRRWTLTRVADRDRPKGQLIGVDPTTILEFPDYSAMIPSVYDNTLSLTTDSGKTWTTIAPSLPPEMHFDAVSFGDRLNGWAVIVPDSHCPAGMSCPMAVLPGPLVATSDGGRTWTTGAPR